MCQLRRWSNLIHCISHVSPAYMHVRQREHARESFEKVEANRVRKKFERLVYLSPRTNQNSDQSRSAHQRPETSIHFQGI